jgi:hypothetical protein
MKHEKSARHPTTTRLAIINIRNEKKYKQVYTRTYQNTIQFQNYEIMYLFGFTIMKTKHTGKSLNFKLEFNNLICLKEGNKSYGGSLF